MRENGKIDSRATDEVSTMTKTVLAAGSDAFDVQRQGEVVVVTPRTLDQLDSDEIDDGLIDAFLFLERGLAKHAVIDCRHADHCCSTAIGHLVGLNNKVRKAGGRMAVCNLSEFMRIKLQVLHLDSMWALCDSRPDALVTVRAG
jgi:anti-anti-sigma regulatory factor